MFHYVSLKANWKDEIWYQTLTEDLTKTYQNLANRERWLFLQLSDIGPTPPSSFRAMRYFINNWPDLCFMTMQGDRCVGASCSCIYKGCIFDLVQKSLVLHDLQFQLGHWGVPRLSFASWTRTGVGRHIEALQKLLLPADMTRSFFTLGSTGGGVGEGCFADVGGYIAMLAVEKELRGKRIGSKLVQLCLDRMRSLGWRCFRSCRGYG